jgi:hypothetical protein
MQKFTRTRRFWFEGFSRIQMPKNWEDVSVMGDMSVHELISLAYPGP